jgi:hypothetical protein
MYGENYIAANDIAKDHIEMLIAEADAERRANAYLAGQKANGVKSAGIVAWFADLVKPNRISTKRV